MKSRLPAQPVRSLQKVPGKMAVISSCTIGLEMGSVWIRLGSEVVVVKLLNSIRGAGINKEILYVHCIFQISVRWPFTCTRFSECNSKKR